MADNDENPGKPWNIDELRAHMAQPVTKYAPPASAQEKEKDPLEAALARRMDVLVNTFKKSIDQFDELGAAVRKLRSEAAQSKPTVPISNAASGTKPLSFEQPFQTQKLPRFETGGVAKEPTAGIFGEKGPEALIPLNNFVFQANASAGMLPPDETDPSLSQLLSEAVSIREGIDDINDINKKITNNNARKGIKTHDDALKAAVARDKRKAASMAAAAGGSGRGVPPGGGGPGNPGDPGDPSGLHDPHEKNKKFPYYYNDIDRIIGHAKDREPDIGKWKAQVGMVAELARTIGGSFSFFGGWLDDANKYRISIREAAFQLESAEGSASLLTRSMGGMFQFATKTQASWEAQSEIMGVALDSSQKLETIQAMYVKNIRSGYKSADQTRRVMRAAATTANAIGADAEQMASYFNDMHIKLDLSGSSLAAMGHSMRQIGKDAKLSGEALLDAIKKADTILETFKRSSSYTIMAAEKVQRTMAIASQKGVVDQTAKILTAMNSSYDLLKADNPTKYLVGSYGGADAMTKIQMGQGNDPEVQKNMAENMAAKFKEETKHLTGGMGADLNNLNALTPKQRSDIDFYYAAMTDGTVRLGDFQKMMESLNEGGKSLSDRMKDSTKEMKVSGRTNAEIDKVQKDMMKDARLKAALGIENVMKGSPSGRSLHTELGMNPQGEQAESMKNSLKQLMDAGALERSDLTTGAGIERALTKTMMDAGLKQRDVEAGFNDPEKMKDLVKKLTEQRDKSVKKAAVAIDPMKKANDNILVITNWLKYMAGLLTAITTAVVGANWLTFSKIFTGLYKQFGTLFTTLINSSNVNALFTNTRATIAAIGTQFNAGIGAAIGTFKNKILGMFVTIGNGIRTIWNFVLPELGGYLAKTFPRFAGAVSKVVGSSLTGPFVVAAAVAITAMEAVSQGYRSEAKAADIFNTTQDALTRTQKNAARQAGTLTGVFNALTFGMLDSWLGETGSLTVGIAKLFNQIPLLGIAIDVIAFIPRKIYDIFWGTWEVVKGLGRMVWGAITGFFSGVFGAIGDTFKDLGKAFGEVFSPLGEAFVEVMNAVGEAWDMVINPIINPFRDLLGVFTGSDGSEIASWMKAVGHAVGWLVSSPFKLLALALRAIVPLVKGFASVVKIAAKFVKGLIWAVRALFNGDLADMFGEVFTSLGGIMAGGIWKGFSALLKGIGGGFGWLMNKIWDGVKWLGFKIYDWTIGLIPWIFGLLIDGLEQAGVAIGIWAAGVGTWIKDGISKGLTDIGTAFTTWASGLWDSFKAKAADIGTWLKDSIVGALSDLGTWIRNAIMTGIPDLGTALKNAILGALPAWLGGVPADAVVDPAIRVNPFPPAVKNPLPEFGTGGIVARGGLAVVGEMGPEIIIPLANALGPQEPTQVRGVGELSSGMASSTSLTDVHDQIQDMHVESGGQKGDAYLGQIASTTEEQQMILENILEGIRSLVEYSRPGPSRYGGAAAAQTASNIKPKNSPKYYSNPYGRYAHGANKGQTVIPT